MKFYTIGEIQKQMKVTESEMIKLASMMTNYPDKQIELQGAATYLNGWYNAIAEDEK